MNIKTKMLIPFLIAAMPMAAMANDYTLKVSMSVGEKDPMFAGAQYLKENVEKRTDGHLKIDIYPSGQLGSVEGVQEMAMFGQNVAAITDSGRLSVFSKEIGVIGVAYAAKDYNQMKDIVETDLFKSWEKKLEKEGLHVLSFNWFQGSRSFMTNKPVNKPEDLNGMLIRTPGSAVWSESISALGATPTALPWAETYPAMQQGVVDGFEAQLPATIAASLQETIKYVAETEHFQLMTALVASEEWFSALPKEYQKILLEESYKAGAYASDVTNKNIAEYKRIMEDDYNVKFIPVDKTPFIARAQTVFKKLGYEKEHKELQDALK
ncbi:C4-dicarboxylate TRAP transporter substrate-binding protein [Marinomonas primoryensis]|uniref:TRAP-type C4-dicarboxylate transport system periplasmic protein DctP n=1 Tax=Marinomonas primoryensis TaxID=178399 RepID=A0A859CSZ9_9GAMM|nr:C4-dicarboxylate TRAP transporter substrate-binding protein [Marinomonas primoryensis]QKK79335.1 TRAP-type C4-dicarboxylate transport system periplasmic protein DctP [Marinomonas primoryensis]